MPLLSRLKAANVATPATAPIVRLPESVAPGVPVPPVTATVMSLMQLVAVLPKASRAVTWIAGVMTDPAVVPLGCRVKASWVGALAVIAKAELIVLVTPAADAASLYPLPAL